MESSFSAKRQSSILTEHPASADELLRVYRQRSGLTQRQLAGFLGFTGERIISKWEGNFALPRPDSLRSLIELYLSRRIFLQGQELQEASRLWAAVKSSYDVRGFRPKSYPEFNKSWFNNLAKPGGTPGNENLGSTITGQRPKSNLLVPPTKFIGRKSELAQIKSLLRNSRLLTLTGPGGIGKTRLALHSAQEVQGDFKDGVWLIELAALGNSEQITRSLAGLFEIKEVAGQPLIDRLISYLKPKELLLILDNCEHLVAECASLVDTLLSYCPELKIVATSRERLRITGETTWQVPALSLPEKFPELQHPELFQLEETRASDAVELFLERAAAVTTGFNLNNHNILAVIELCHHLDGLPLAIELAAVRTRMLSVEQITSRLSDRFNLLTSTSQIGIPRQNSLQALIDWSFELLSNKEQTTLIRLAVFAGDFTLEAAEVICAGTAGGKEIFPQEVLSLLSELIAKSLVSTRRLPGVVRYILLETIRLYAQEKLEATGQEKECRETHLKYYLDLVAKDEPGLNSGNRQDHLELIGSAYANCQTALNFAIDEEITDQAIQFCNHLFPFWETKAYYTEAKAFLERSLELPGPSNKAERAQAIINLSRLAELQGNYGAGIALATQSLESGREIASDKIISGGLHSLGNLQMWLGNYAASRELFTQGLNLQQRLCNEHGVATSLSSLGLVASFQSDYPTASKFYLEALSITRKIGDEPATANNFSSLGIIRLNQGNYAEARAFFEDCLVGARKLDNRRIVASNLTNLGIVAFYQGNYQEAQTLYTESLALHKAVGNNPHASNVLINLGELHKTQGHYEAAQDYTFSALKMKNEMGDKWGIAMCFNNLGNIATNLGHYTEAREYCLESLTLREALDNKQGIASCFNNLGTIELQEGNFDSASKYYSQSLDLQRQLNDISGIIKVLTNLGLAAARQGKTGEAKRYLIEIKELNPASQNHLLLASIFATMVVLFSEEPGKEADCAFLVKVIETLLIQSGGVLEEAFLQPYHKVTVIYGVGVGKTPGQSKDEATPAQETSELIQAALNVTL